MSTSSSVDPPHAFHPYVVTNTSIIPSLWALGECTLSLDYDFSPSFILDRFQIRELVDENRLVSYHLGDGGPSVSTLTGDVEYYVWGERDLEKPVSKVQTGTQMRVKVLPPPLSKATSSSSSSSPPKHTGPPSYVVVQLPIHLRYLDPRMTSSESLIKSIDANSPTVYWQCPRRSKLDIAIKPCENQSPGDLKQNHYESGLTHLQEVASDPEYTRYYINPTSDSNNNLLLPPSSSSSSIACVPPDPQKLEILVPVGDATVLAPVTLGQFTIVWAAFLWLVWKAVKVWKSSSPTTEPPSSKKTE